MRTLNELQTAAGEWADKQFPGQPTLGKIKHLVKEANELAEHPDDLIEMADCLNLLLQVARDAGYTGDDVITAGFAKLEICKGREWGQPDEHGTVEHVREVKS